MKTTPLPSLAAIALAALAPCPALRAEPLVGFVGQNMRAFDSTSPGSTTFLATLAGLDIFEQVHAIERKPVSGELFVLTNLPGPTNQYKLRVAYANGANTVLGSSFNISGSTKWAFALQPDNTTLRVVSNNGVNLRMNTTNGDRTTDTTLVYAAGDRAVKDVFVDGRKVVADGQVVTMDYQAAAAHLHEAQKRVIANAPAQDWAHRPVEVTSPPTFRWS